MSTRKQFFNSNSNSKEITECNIALLGALGSGKSALTVKYITKRFIMEYDPTLEDTFSKQAVLDNQEMVIRIMDTYDKEETNPDRYLKWAQGYLVVYSITSRTSLERARHYLDILAQYQRLGASDRPTILVGNKMDLERYRTVSQNEGQQLANQYDCVFHETSAAEDFESVERVFNSLVRDVLHSKERQLPLQPLFITEDRSGLLGSGATGAFGNGAGRVRRTKSPKGVDSKDKKEEKEQRAFPRRIEKIFNKSFKIFN